MALSGLAQEVAGRNHDPVQDDRAGRGAVEAHLLLLAANGQARRVALDEEGAEGLTVDLGVHGEEVCERGVGDELLAPIQAPRAIRLTSGPGADPHRVRAGAGLRERIGADERAVGEPGKVALLLLIGAEEDGRQGADPGMRRVRHRERPGAGHGLVDDQGADPVQPGTAVRLRHVDPQVSVAAEPRQERPVCGVVLPVLSLYRLTAGDDLLLDEVADRIANRAVLLGELLRGEDASRGRRAGHEGPAPGGQRGCRGLGGHAASSARAG